MSVSIQPSTAYLALGSNLGDRFAHLRAAVYAIDSLPEVDLILPDDVACVFETTPIGGPPGQNRYLNTVVRVRTSMSPGGLLAATQGIETAAGRVRKEHLGPRVLDIDLLLHDDLTIHDKILTLPHPRMHERRFVLEPLAQLAPSVHHPILRATISALLGRLPEVSDEVGAVVCQTDRRWCGRKHGDAARNRP